MEELQRIGLDVPQVTQLAYRLATEGGMDIPTDILHSAEAVEALVKLYEKMTLGGDGK